MCLGHICASRVVGLVAPHVAPRRATSFKFKNVVAARFSSATRTSRVATPPFPSRARARQFREKRRKKKETLWHHPISRYRRSTRLRDDDTTNDVSKIKSYLDVVERPFTEEFHFLRGEFSHDVRALCVARCSFSRFSQHTQVVVLNYSLPTKEKDETFQSIAAFLE